MPRMWNFLGCTFECREVSGIDSEAPVQVEVDFDRVILEDNEEDGRLTGEVEIYPTTKATIII